MKARDEDEDSPLSGQRYRDLKLTRHETVWRGRRLQVVRPRFPVRRAYPIVHGGTPYVVAENRACLRLAALTWYAALHPDVLVHVPLRGPLPSLIQSWTAHPTHASDLVFLHHSLAFRPSAWRDVRNRLGTGSHFTASVERPGEWLWERFNRLPVGRLQHDLLDFAHQSDTIFVVGSLTALGYAASAFHGMSRCTSLDNHIHLRYIARHENSYQHAASDDLIITHYSERLYREWEE